MVRALPADKDPPIQPSAPELSDDSRDTLRLRLMGIGLEEYRLRQQLERCQTGLAQMRRREQALPALREARPVDNAYAVRWLTQFAGDAAAI